MADCLGPEGRRAALAGPRLRFRHGLIRQVLY